LLKSLNSTGESFWDLKSAGGPEAMVHGKPVKRCAARVFSKAWLWAKVAPCTGGYGILSGESGLIHTWLLAR